MKTTTLFLFIVSALFTGAQTRLLEVDVMVTDAGDGFVGLPELATGSLQTGTIARVKGQTTPGDGGGGEFRWDGSAWVKFLREDYATAEEADLALKTDGSQTLTLTQKTNLASTWPEAVAGGGVSSALFYDTFARTEAAGTMGTSDTGQTWSVSGSGVAGTTVEKDYTDGLRTFQSGRLINLADTPGGPFYAHPDNFRARMMGVRVRIAYVEPPEGYVGTPDDNSPVVLIPSSDGGINEGSELVHAFFGKGGIGVSLHPNGFPNVGGVGVPDAVQFTTSQGSMFIEPGFEFTYEVVIKGDMLVVRHPWLPGGAATYQYDDLETWFADGFVPVYELFNNDPYGWQSYITEAWASEDPDYVSPFRTSDNHFGNTDTGDKILYAGDPSKDVLDQDVQIPGGIKTHNGRGFAQTWDVDPFALGLVRAEDSVDPTLTYVRKTGNLTDLPEAGEELVFEVFGQAKTPDGVNDVVQFTAFGGTLLTFTPEDIGTATEKQQRGVWFRWVVRRTTDDPGPDVYTCVVTATVGSESKSAVRQTTNWSSNDPAIVTTGDCWYFHSASLTRR